MAVVKDTLTPLASLSLPLPVYPSHSPHTPAYSLEKVDVEEMVTDVSSTECQLTILVPLLSSCNTNFTILHHLWGEVREGQVREGEVREGSQGYQHAQKAEVLYSGKLLREKTFMDFAVSWLFAKFGGVVSMAQASNPRKFLHENRIFTNSQKFSLSKFSRFAVVTDVNCDIRILHYLQTKSISIQTCFN